MKIFKFRLQIKKLKKSIRQKALESYGKAIAETEKLQAELENKKSDLIQLQKQIHLKRTSEFFGNSEENYQRSIVVANTEILEAHTNLQNAMKLQESKRELFLKADSEFKSLDKLNQKQKTAHEFSEMKKEEFEVDDVIGARFVYNSKLS